MSSAVLPDGNDSPYPHFPERRKTADPSTTCAGPGRVCPFLEESNATGFCGLIGGSVVEGSAVFLRSSSPWPLLAGGVG
jgi:hypothetical protein